MLPWKIERSSIAGAGVLSRPACSSRRFFFSSLSRSSICFFCSSVSSGTAVGSGAPCASSRIRLRVSSSVESSGPRMLNTVPPRASAHLSTSPTTPSCGACCGPLAWVCRASEPVLGLSAKPCTLNV